MLLSSACCKDNGEKQPEELVVAPITNESLITTKSSEIFVRYTDANLFGTVKNKDGFSYSEYGFLYGTDESNVNIWVSGNYSEGKITAELKGLDSGKKYWYRAAAKLGRTTYQSKTVESFITFPQGPVDLDLPSGTKWASSNLGAELPTELGYFYAWGEVAPKNNYDWTEYAYCNGTYNSLTKYTHGKYLTADGVTPDNIYELLVSDDAATQLLGEHYHTPTYQDWKELIDNSIITRIDINGVYAAKFSSKKDIDNSEKFIILQGDTRYYKGVAITTHDSGSYYWTATVNNATDYTWDNAYTVKFLITSGGASSYYQGLPRAYGLPIRPVYR